MATQDELNKWRRNLQSGIPLLGSMFRRKAMAAIDAHGESAETVPILIDALSFRDAEVTAWAKAALAKLKEPGAVDALCDAAIREPSSPAAQICASARKRNRDPERACLLLFVTRQLDAYFEEDHEFQNLRLQFERADAVVRGHVWEVVRSGDRRCSGFMPAKKLSECSDEEKSTALASWMRHKDWARLLDACMELPLKYTLPVLPAFRDARWEPDAADRKAVLRSILQDIQEASVAAPKKPAATSSLFDQWLARGRAGELVQLGETELLKRFQNATPPDGVAIVAALSVKAKPDSAAARAVKESPHGTVRLAGLCTGLTLDITRDVGSDPNYWVKEIGNVSGVLEFWPSRATPADLEALSAAPAEAWTGKLGAARRILRVIMTHRVDVPEGWSPLEVGPDELAPEIVPVGKA